MMVDSSLEAVAGAGRRAGRVLALAALLAVVAAAAADSSIVVLAVPDLLARFGVSIAAVSWVVTAYNLALALVALAYARAPGRLRGAAGAARVGAALFLAGSVGSAIAPSIWVLIALRVVQGAGAGLLLVGALPLIRALTPSRQRGTALWAAAGVFGAALGPALGGVLTDLFSWRAIFVAQVPVAALGLAAALAVRPRGDEAADGPAPARRRGASIALALASAALVGLLFLAVLELIDVWRLSPLAAAAVVSVIPVATLLSQPLAARLGPGALTTGAILLAAGLAGMGFLPTTSVVWVVAALTVAGAGLGLLLPGLTHRVLAEHGPSATGAAQTVWIRHAGLVAGILLLTPLLTSDLAAAGQSAELRGIAVVLDAPVSVTTKARLAIDLAPVLTQPASKELPDFTSALAPQHDPALTGMGEELDHVIQATITRGFRRSYLLAALLALLALVPLTIRRRADASVRSRAAAAAVAFAVALALVGAELAGGAEAFGAQPRLLPACAARPAQAAGADAQLQELALKGLDFVACRLHTTREQLILDAGRWISRVRADITRWAEELGITAG